MKIFLVMAVTLFISMSCFARIGETEAQCEKRYDGSDGGHRSERAGDDFAIAYEKAGITTTCTFHYSIKDICPWKYFCVNPAV